MAEFKIEGFKELDRMFEQVSKPQYFQTKAVKAAAPALVKAARDAIKAAGGGDRLARSVEASEPKENQYGVFVVVQPEGRRSSDGTHYVKLAAALEYGTVWPRKKEDAAKIHHADKAGMHKNDARPWRQKAINAAEGKCEDAMREAVYSEISKLVGGLQ